MTTKAECRAAWNGTSHEGKRWDDLSVLQQQRLEDFADDVCEDLECQVSSLSEDVGNLGNEVDGLREELEAAQNQIVALSKPKTP